jgi:hypothetical protein
MAIAIQPKYPPPDRSDQKIKRVKDEDDVIDIGWCEGVTSDGRPFRAEMWAQTGVSMLTVFFSRIGLEGLDEEALKQLLIKERIVSFRDEAPQHFVALPMTDDAGNDMWSANVVVGDEDGTFLADSVPVFAHPHDAPVSTFYWRSPAPVPPQSD